MILIVLSVSLTALSFWHSYIMFLIMIGGMLVLFMYMTSVASNEKFKFSSIGLAISITTITYTITIQTSDYWMKYTKIINTEETSKLKSFLFSLNKFLNEPSYTLSIILIMYLLITLIAVIKIVNINLGPIRYMN
uniref:NADH-ubiquinone oxidoreductase chain 6 n=1 Tax=Lucanus mazama TaxID=590157 RepID=D1G5L9_9SCAR|nr:NADH dehydrogenase subunit 6 [Lucanus mazama]ACM45034.1 NADH dehydrogenase subunit 6 [Lucanus mazama]